MWMWKEQVETSNTHKDLQADEVKIIGSVEVRGGRRYDRLGAVEQCVAVEEKRGDGGENENQGDVGGGKWKPD